MEGVIPKKQLSKDGKVRTLTLNKPFIDGEGCILVDLHDKGGKGNYNTLLYISYHLKSNCIETKIHKDSKDCTSTTELTQTELNERFTRILNKFQNYTVAFSIDDECNKTNAGNFKGQFPTLKCDLKYIYDAMLQYAQSDILKTQIKKYYNQIVKEENDIKLKEEKRIKEQNELIRQAKEEDERRKKLIVNMANKKAEAALNQTASAPYDEILALGFPSEYGKQTFTNTLTIVHEREESSFMSPEEQIKQLQNKRLSEKQKPEPINKEKSGCIIL